jgi:hypothetical protein
MKAIQSYPRLHDLRLEAELYSDTDPRFHPSPGFDYPTHSGVWHLAIGGNGYTWKSPPVSMDFITSRFPNLSSLTLRILDDGMRILSYFQCPYFEDSQWM